MLVGMIDQCSCDKDFGILVEVRVDREAGFRSPLATTDDDRDALNQKSTSSTADHPVHEVLRQRRMEVGPPVRQLHLPSSGGQQHL